MNNITSRIVKRLALPKLSSHKGENGRLLIIAGSKQYHGSLVYAVKAASKIVDLVYVLTTPENRELVRKLKEKTAEFISISDPNFRIHPNDPNDFDCILIGPGMGVGKRTYKLVKQVLKSGKRAVLDADALNVMDPKLLKLLNKRHILTPHKREFRKAFNSKPTTRNLRLAAKKYGCTIVLKGPVDYVASKNKPLTANYTGNEGMTKGGTGDVLAGLIAAFYCTNDAYISSAAGVFVNGLAGDELYKKVGAFYNAEDLLGQVPKTLWSLVRSSKIKNQNVK